MKRWKVSDFKASEVICITTCPKEEYIAIAFKNNTIAYCDINKLLE